MASEHIILGVHISNRVKCVPDVQALFSKYGCAIRTRIGLHDVHDDYCSPSGMILLEMTGKKNQIRKLEKKLKAIKGVEVQKMVFSQ